MLCFLVYFEMSVLLMLSKLASKGSQHFFYGVLLACLAFKEQCSRHFQSTLYLSFKQNIFDDKGRHMCAL